MRRSRRVAAGWRTRAGVALALLLALATSSIAGSKSSTQKPSREELCARAVAEVEASRTLITDLEARLTTAREQIAAAEVRIKLGDERGELLEERVRLYTEQVKAYETALEVAKKNLELLRQDLERVRAERDSARRQRTTWALVAAIGGAALGALAAGGR